MSVNRASEVWKEIKPFAIRDMNRMLDNKAGDSGDDLYAIILYDESAQKIKYYSMSDLGLQAALAAASSGDIVLIPAGTITPSSESLFILGDEIGNGSIPVTNQTGIEITGLTIGEWYAVEATGGPWKEVGLILTEGLYRFQADFGSGFTGETFQVAANYIGSEYLELLHDYESYPLYPEAGKLFRVYWQAINTTLKLRVADVEGLFADNIGSLGYLLRHATPTDAITVPNGVEVVGLGKNTVINTGFENNGILTNIQVTGAITGSGISRMVSNPTVELFSNQIKSLIVSGTAPFIIGSSTVNENLNADLLDGEHASAFADASHTHTESDITDLDHDAAKIDGIQVDLTGITDGQIIKYDNATTKLIAGNDEGGGALADLTDVDLTGLADGDVLVYDDTSGDWLPETPAAGITVGEVDEAPSISNVNKIIFPNESVTDNLDGSASIEFPAPFSLIVQEIDETPSISGVNKINVTNGTLTNGGSGEITLDFGSAATDGSAIHDNVSGEIHAITEETSPASNDEILIESAANSYAKKRVKISNIAKVSIGARVYNNAAISIPNTGADLTFNSERYDTDNIHDISTNPSRLTCKTAGKYLIIGNIEWAPNNNGVRDARIVLNGTTIIGIVRVAAAGGSYFQVVSTIYDLSVNDYVVLHAYQDGAGALNVNSSGNFSPEFMMQKIG